MTTHLTTPLGDEVLDLQAGDRVTLTGMVYTARDEAHLRIRVIAAGPTTSARMNTLTGFLLDAGVRALIGKGGMNDDVLRLLEGRAVYLAFTGGCAALAASRMKVRGVWFEELGMPEAVWALELDHLPLTVGMDAHGHNLFGEVAKHAQAEFARMFPE